MRFFHCALVLVALSSGTLFAQNENYSLLFKDGQPIHVSRSNNSGVSVAVSCQGSSGILLKDDKYTLIPMPNGTTHCELDDINDAGDVVGTYAGPTSASFLRTSNGVFTTLQVPGQWGTFPKGLNNRGAVVGNFFLPGNVSNQGFIYSKGTYTIVAVPGAVGVILHDINDLGDAVGKVTVQCNPVCQSYPFLYRNGNIIPLPTYPGATTTEVTGINNRGEMTGYGYDGDYTGFILRDGQFETLRFPGAHRVVPLGINDKGEVTGQYVVATPGASPADFFGGTSFIRRPR